MAWEQYDKPKQVDVVEVVPQMKVLGKALKQAGKAVAAHLEALPEADALSLKVRYWYSSGGLALASCHMGALACKSCSAALRRQAMLQAKLEEAGSAEVSVGGETHTLQKDMVTIEKVTKSRSGHNYTPSVIEPSFGIGRIVYCVFEHTFYVRSDDAQKTVFRFSPQVAPMKTTVFPLLQRKELNDAATSISLALRRAGVSSIIDTTSATPRV